MEDAADIVPAQPAESIAAFQHALKSFMNRIHLDTFVQRGPHDRPDSSIHSWGIAATGEYANSFHR
jgi:hypothetical protein